MGVGAGRGCEGAGRSGAGTCAGDGRGGRGAEPGQGRGGAMGRGRARSRHAGVAGTPGDRPSPGPPAGPSTAGLVLSAGPPDPHGVKC